MIKSIVLDISKHLSTATQTIVLRQGDINSLTLNIAINEDDIAFDLTNYEARFMAQLQSGQVIIDPCEKTGANMLNYTLPSALSAKPGTISLSYVAIYQNEKWVASTQALAFYVLPGVDISADEAESILSEFLALKAKLDAILEESAEQQVAQQSSWEKQQAAQQTLWEEQMQEQRDALNTQSKEQQALWEAQMQTQNDAFADAESERAKAEAERVSAEASREAAVQEALESLGGLTIDTITPAEIDEIWANTE